MKSGKKGNGWTPSCCDVDVEMETAPSSLPAGVEQQTVRRKASATIQHPPPPPPGEFLSSPPPAAADVRLSSAAPRPFWVLNPENIGGRVGGEFATDLLLEETPTAGQVREAVAASLAVSPQTVRLERDVGRRRGDGAEAFWFYDDRRGVWTFADAEGAEIPGEEVEDWRWQPLNDADPFVLVPGWRNYIIIHRR